MSLQVSGVLPGCVPSQASAPGDLCHPTAIRGLPLPGVDSGWGGRPKKCARAACRPVSWGSSSGDVVGTRVPVPEVGAHGR